MPRLAEDPAKNPLRSPRYAFKTGSPALGSTVTPTVAGEPTRWSSTLHQVSAGLPGKSPFTAYAEELGPLLAPGSAVAGPQFLDSPSDAAFCGSQLPLRPMETPGLLGGGAPPSAKGCRRRAARRAAAAPPARTAARSARASALAAAAAAGASAGAAAAAAILGAGEATAAAAAAAPGAPVALDAAAAADGGGGAKRPAEGAAAAAAAAAAHEMEAKRPKGGKAARRLDRTVAPPAGAPIPGRAAAAAEAAPRRSPRRSLPGTGAAAAAAAALDPNISTDILTQALEAGATAGGGGVGLPGALVSGQAVVDSLFDDAALQKMIRGGGRTKSRQGKKKACNCKNSRCLKLYCDCFSAGDHCMPNCKCNDCGNFAANESEIEKVRKEVQKRNPKAFTAKFAEQQSPSKGAAKKHTRGCNCKNSRCMKNYCECYSQGVSCSLKCKCIGCENGGPATRAPPRRARPRGGLLLHPRRLRRGAHPRERPRRRRRPQRPARPAPPARRSPRRRRRRRLPRRPRAARAAAARRARRGAAAARADAASGGLPSPLFYEEIDAAAAAAARRRRARRRAATPSVGLLHRPAAAFGAADSPVARGGDGVRRIPSAGSDGSDASLASRGSRSKARRPPPSAPSPSPIARRPLPSSPAVGLIEMADMLNPDELQRMDIPRPSAPERRTSCRAAPSR